MPLVTLLLPAVADAAAGAGAGVAAGASGAAGVGALRCHSKDGSSRNVSPRRTCERSMRRTTTHRGGFVFFREGLLGVRFPSSATHTAQAAEVLQFEAS